MNFVSLFAGIGGIDLGLERAGMRCVGQVEIDPFCRSVLAKHWPEVPKHEDVRTVTASTFLGPVDVIAGGFPCQDISSAGRREGIGGQRSGLWFEYLRLVREVRPRYVFVENVSAILFRGLDVVLGGLAESGFDAEWACLPASMFGFDHNRDRLWLVAYANGLGREAVDVRKGVRRQAVHPGHSRHIGTVLRPRIFRHPPGRVDVPARPPILGSDHGVRDRAHRIKGCGNAVVPQVAEWIGRQIIAAEGGVTHA